MSGRALPARVELVRVLHDVHRLGLDARREMIVARQRAADAQADLVDLEFAAQRLALALRSASRPKFQLSIEVQEHRAAIAAQINASTPQKLIG